MTPAESSEFYKNAQYLMDVVWIFIGIGLGGCIIWLLQFIHYYSQGVKELRDNEIRVIAHSIWEEEGYPQGRDKEHWLKARKKWKEEHSRINIILTYLRKNKQRNV